MKTIAVHMSAMTSRLEDSMSEGRVYPVRALLAVAVLALAATLARAL